MPRFAGQHALALPATFTAVIPGKIHPDGRRYLPLLIWTLANGLKIGTIDRHHLIDQHLVGRAGSLGIIFLLSTLALQPTGNHRLGLDPDAAPDRPSTAPTAYGKVSAVLSWELQQETLAFETVYAELLLDIGIGIVGVRTATAAPSLASAIGKTTLAAGDWITVGRSRIDVLAWTPADTATADGAFNGTT
ncbi:MAG: hypothetical protein NVS2B7_28420 [Herpetosiphon sp.]